MLSPRVVYCDDGTTLTLGILIFKMQDQVSIGRSLKAQARILKVGRSHQSSILAKFDLGKVRSRQNSVLAKFDLGKVRSWQSSILAKFKLRLIEGSG